MAPGKFSTFAWLCRSAPPHVLTRVARFRPMLRFLVLLAVLAACGIQRTPVTTKVITLGYSHPPAIVVMLRGAEELSQAWVEGLRASGYARIVAEVKPLDVPDAQDEMCKAALETANVTPIDEIIVIASTQLDRPIEKCAASATAACGRQVYAGMTVYVTTTVTAYRASTCTMLRSTSMPIATGTSGERPTIDYNTSYGAPDGITIDDAKESDLRDAHKNVIEEIAAFASNVSWRVFPTDSSIQRVDERRIVIAGPLELGDYFLKTPSSTELQKGVQAVSVERNQTTLELDESLELLEPGDELHGISDMRTVTGFTTVNGGIARAEGKTHGIGGAAVVARWTWDHSPKMFEMQFGADLVPGIDSRHVGVGLAGGFRIPYWISPYVIVELGLGGVFQGDHGARAVAGRAGVGAGLEVRRTRWFAYADLRLRGFALGEYTDSEENPISVTYTDNTWGITTVQLGLGLNL